MHVALTDVLTCPQCGAGHGLILVPSEVRDRRVVSGVLGCPDCRTRYPIAGGVADLSAGSPVVEGVGEGEGEGDEAGAVRLAGLLGLGAGQGVVLLTGPAAEQARRLAALVDGVEVVAARRPFEGGSAVRLGEALPFQTARLRGVALTGPSAAALLEEGARVLGPGGRLLVDSAPADARERLGAAGLRVLAEEGGALVATR